MSLVQDFIYKNQALIIYKILPLKDALNMFFSNYFLLHKIVQNCIKLCKTVQNCEILYNIHNYT